MVFVSALANAGEDKTRQGEKVYIGEGLSLVPEKLAKKILFSEYVEIEELLPKVCTQEDTELEGKEHCLRRVSDIFMWFQCFGVDTSVCGAQSPGVISELMAYMGTIIRANRETPDQSGSSMICYSANMQR